MNFSTIMGNVGIQGSGKTAVMTALGYGEYINHGRKIIANYKLKFKYLYLDFDDIIKMLDSGKTPEKVKDINGELVDFKPLVKKTFGINIEHIDQLFQGVVMLMDELHVAARAYNHLSTASQVLSNFISQVRKRDIFFLYTTQKFTKVVKQIRDETNFVNKLEKSIHGDSVVKIDLITMHPEELINTRYMDISYVYKLYNTKEVIRFTSYKHVMDQKKEVNKHDKKKRVNSKTADSKRD